MTLETTFNIPAQLIVNGESIDVMVQAVTSKIEENPLEHVYVEENDNGETHLESYFLGKNIKTITTYECVKIENEEVF